MCLGLDIWVPEIVQTCVRHTDRGHDLLVVVVKGAGGQVVAPCVREYIPAVMPEGTSFQPVPGLLGLYASSAVLPRKWRR